MSELIDLALEEAGEKMAGAVAHARSEFSKVRTGRPNPALIEKLSVEYYGTPVPLQQLASITIPEPRLLAVNAHDKNSVSAIEKAIRNSDLGLNPSNDGVIIRLAFPPLTEERRKELVKKVRAMAEDGKIAVRNARRDTRRELDGLARDGDASEDEVSRGEKDLDRLTHEHEAGIDKALQQKEAELLEV
jgi:ribosome recycling factor